MKTQEEMTEDPPCCPLRYFLWDFDDEYARNVLIHFLVDKGIDGECIEYLKKHGFEGEEDHV